jgi:hypothetical protein
MKEKSCKELDMEMVEPFLLDSGRRYRNNSGLYSCPRCNWLKAQPPGIPYGAVECPHCHAKVRWA